MKWTLVLFAAVVLGFGSVYGQLGGGLTPLGEEPPATLPPEMTNITAGESTEGFDPVEIGLANLSYPGYYVVVLYVRHPFRVAEEVEDLAGYGIYTVRDEYAIRNMDITIRVNATSDGFGLADYNSESIGFSAFVDGLRESEYQFYEAAGGRFYQVLLGEPATALMTINVEGNLRDRSMTIRVSSIGAYVGESGVPAYAQGIRSVFTAEPPVDYYPALAYFVFIKAPDASGEVRMWIEEVRATSITGRELNPVIKNAVLWGGTFVDCNRDGRLTTADALAALQMSVGEIEPDSACDVDGDGRITSNDAVELLMRAVGG